MCFFTSYCTILCMKIILADYGQYSLFRKSHNPHNRSFGLGYLLNQLHHQHTPDSFQVHLIINHALLPNEYDYLMQKYPFIKSIHYRSTNRGFDFGAYNEGYHYLKQINYSGQVIFMNSVCDIHTPHFLSEYDLLFHSEPNIGVCSATYNGLAFQKNINLFNYKPNCQSYFLFTHMTILSHVFPDHLPGYLETTKKNVIIHGEVAFSTQLLLQGYRLKAKLHGFSYAKNEPWIWGPDHFDRQTFLNTRYKV